MKDIAFCWTFRNWFVLYFNILSLIVTYSTWSQFTWQGHRKLQWPMSKDEPLLSNCPLQTAEPSRNYARVPGHKKNTRKRQEKRREKKRKMNGEEINTRAYVATRLLLRWDYLYAVTLKTKVFGDYNHARLEVSWITSTRGLLLRGYTGRIADPERSASNFLRFSPTTMGELTAGSDEKKTWSGIIPTRASFWTFCTVFCAPFDFNTTCSVEEGKLASALALL